MTQKITAIKCPHCGSTHKHPIEKDRYQCNSCDSEYIFDSGDLNIIVNHHHTMESPESSRFFSMPWLTVSLIGFVMVLIVIYNFIPKNSDNSYQKEKNIKPQPVASISLGENISIGISAEGISEVRNLVTKPFNSSNKKLDACFVYSGICHKIFINRITFLGGKKGLNIRGMNKSIWEALAEQRKFTTLVDWLDLSMDDLLSVGLSERQAKKTFEQIQLASQQSFEYWMNGIYQVGFPSQINQYTWSDIQSWSVNDWQTLMELSEAKAKPYYQLTHSEEMNQLVVELQQYKIIGF